MVYDRKKLSMRNALASELGLLGHLASDIARAGRRTRDFTYHALRDAIAEIVACFPVYRTYLTRNRIQEPDQRHLHWAIAQAKKRTTSADIQVFDFLEELLTLSRLDDCRAKLYLTWKTLNLRQRYPRVFSEGEYLSLDTDGPSAMHLCAFARRFEAKEVLVATARWFAQLVDDTDQPVLKALAWDSTRVHAPPGTLAQRYRNVLSDETIEVQVGADRAWLAATDLFRFFPVALLINELPDRADRAENTFGDRTAD